MTGDILPVINQDGK